MGNDGAGEVTKVAQDVTNFQVGDRIVFQGISPSPNGRKGTFQQYCVVSAVNAAKVKFT
jgi:NADPH:quinone reductase-like Zn-dependent oxidoreductase